MRAILERGALLTGLFLVGLISAAPAVQAKEIPSPWKWTDYGATLRDVSCPSARTCVAVGVHGATLRDTRESSPSLAWSKAFLPDPEEFTGVTCKHSFCLAVSNSRTAAATVVSRIYRSTNGGAKWTLIGALDPAGAAKTRSALSVACDPARDCYAVGPAGGVWHSLDEGLSWHPLALPAKPGAYSRVVCPAAKTCVAVGGDSAGASALIQGATVTDIPLPKGAGAGILGLACDTATRCTATDGLGHYMLLSIPNKAWGPAKTLPDLDVVGKVVALACPAENSCVAIGEQDVGLQTTRLSSSTGDWVKVRLGTKNLQAVDCAGADCVAVGKLGTWFESHDAGFKWRRVNEVAAFDAIQCSANLRPTCVASGKEDIGVSRSAGELWSLPLASSLGLDTKSVNCTGPSECLFLGKGSTRYTTNLEHFTLRHPTTTAPAGADALTCVTKDVCVGLSSGIVYTTFDGALTSWTQNAFPGAATSLACLPGRTDPVVCVATTLHFILVGTMTQTAGLVTWNWETAHANPSQALTAVGCSPGGQCTAVGMGGVVLTTLKTDLTHWKETILPSAATPVADRPQLDGVACPSDGVCLAGGKHGIKVIIASTTNNWADFSYDQIEGVDVPEATVSAFGCESVERCVAVGGSVLVGTRKG